MPHLPGLLLPEPLSLRQASADPCHRRRQHSQAGLAQSLVEVPAPSPLLILHHEAVAAAADLCTLRLRTGVGRIGAQHSVELFLPQMQDPDC